MIDAMGDGMIIMIVFAGAWRGLLLVDFRLVEKKPLHIELRAGLPSELQAYR